MKRIFNRGISRLPRSQSTLGGKNHLIYFRIGRKAPSRNKAEIVFMYFVNFMNFVSVSGDFICFCSEKEVCQTAKTIDKPVLGVLKFMKFISSLGGNSFITNVTDSLPKSKKNDEYMNIHELTWGLFPFLAMQ